MGPLVEGFEARRDPDRAAAMARYMRNQFPFLGIPSPERRACQREVLAVTGRPEPGKLGPIALAAWRLPEREYQYFACDLLRADVRRAGPGLLATLRRLVVSKPWWDTVDALASRAVGPLVLEHAELRDAMEGWVVDGDRWIVRAALLHQLTYKAHTDHDQLFRFCLVAAPSTDFFLRKAIGWALREYSKVDAQAVTGFVARHADELSPLSRREALIWLERRRAAAR